jgi:adenine-specific DNA-methyltransferase
MPSLDFKGKQFVYAHHLSVPFKQLDINKKKSHPKDAKPSLEDNLIINGDNLHALKALLPKYAGKIKCIYIDPPYNTGEEGWCYNDKVNAPLIKEWLKDSANPVDKEDLERHDKWLCMMWPRLQLLHELLSDDGIIFISIDENEVSHLRVLMDEIFGENNFVEEIVWNKRIPKNDKGIGNIHEYVLLYVKSSEQKQKFSMPKDGLDDVYTLVKNLKRKKVPIPEAEKELKKLYKRKGYDRAITLYNGLDDNYKIWGKHNLAWPNAKTGPRYDVLHPQANKPVKVPDNGWRWKEETFNEYLDYENTIERHDGSLICGNVWFAKDENTQPSSIKYLDDVKDMLLRSFISLKSSGGVEFSQIIPEVEFPHPKTYKLIKQLITSIDDPDALILDSFAGSATTAHAVLAANYEDGGNRKFILIEMEDYADEITAERVRRVIKGIPHAKDDFLKQKLGGSFTFCDLGQEMNIENLLKGKKLPKYDELARYAFYTATGLTLDDVNLGADYFIGETQNYRVHLIYKPDVSFLRSGESALSMPLAKSISEARNSNGKAVLVFATHKFMGQKELIDMGITFCQLPYAIHRVIGD